MKLTSRKVIAVNILILFLTLCAKIWNYFSLTRMGKIFSDNGGGKISADFTNLFLHQYEDVRIAITDFSIYLIIIGLLLNLLFLYNFLRKPMK